MTKKKDNDTNNVVSISSKTIKKSKSVYDEAIEEAPHLGKYIREIEEQEQAERKVPATAQITKIKIGKDEKYATILYNTSSSKASKEVTFKGYEDAVDEFIVDFRGMSKHIIETLDFPEEWLPRLTTTGLSITWKDEDIMGMVVTGMVITAQLSIDGLNAPFNLNTPFVQVYSYHSANDSCEDVCFSRECEKLLEKIIAHSKRYMPGLTAAPKQQKIGMGG